MKQSNGLSSKITYDFIIKKLLDNTQLDKKKLYISQAIKNIDQTGLLNDIIFRLAEEGLVNFNDVIVLTFKKELAKFNFSEDIKTQIRAEFLSVFLDYDVRATYFKKLTQQEKPILNFKIRRKRLFHNYDEIFDLIKTRSVIFQEKEIKKLPTNEQEEAYKTIIREAKLFQYQNESNEFKKELKLFKSLRRNTPSTQKKIEQSKTEHPFIVLNAKKLFDEYVSKYIIDLYIDYSYLFQRLLHEKFIIRLTHTQFMNWLMEKGYIDERKKNILLEKESFRSLTKSSSANRENNFNITFKELLKTP